MEFEQDINSAQSASDQIIKNAKLSEQNSNGNSTLIPEGNKQKAKRGRPRKENNDEPKKVASPENEKTDKDPKFVIPTEVLCYPILKGVSAGAVVLLQDKRAAMSADEAEGMAKGLGLVLDKYMPDAMAKWGPEIAFGVSMGQYGLRLYAVSQIKKHEAYDLAVKQAATNQEKPSGDQTTVFDRQMPQEPVI